MDADETPLRALSTPEILRKTGFFAGCIPSRVASAASRAGDSAMARRLPTACCTRSRDWLSFCSDCIENAPWTRNVFKTMSPALIDTIVSPRRVMNNRKLLRLTAIDSRLIARVVELGRAIGNRMTSRKVLMLPPAQLPAVSHLRPESSPQLPC